MDTGKYREEVAARVARLIEDSDMTMVALAEDTGIARTTLIRRLRTGGFTVPELHEIARVLGRDVHDFFPQSEEAVA